MGMRRDLIKRPWGQKLELLQQQWKTLQFFVPEEFGEDWWAMDIEFMYMLDDARAAAGIPFAINSEFRRGDKRSHGRGRAADIDIDGGGRQRWIIVTALMAVGFNRIGIYDGHIHADNMTNAEGFPEEVLWPGKSK